MACCCHSRIVRRVLSNVWISTFATTSLPPTCDNNIYCQGDLLATVQLRHIFPDSKTFVDMDLKENPDKVLHTFNELKSQFNDEIPTDTLKQFVDDNFRNCHISGQCSDLESWTPPDWKDKPSIVNKVIDPAYKQWAFNLNKIWKELSRKMSDDVRTNENMTSLIYVPNGFIIPGGRFLELYYWDTYWIVKGLLICDMRETAKGVIGNFLHLVKKIGHIPNGSRVYYLQRSQPPMLILMMEAYLQRTRDWNYISENIETLEAEMEYFIQNRQVKVSKDGKDYEMFRYYAASSGPRPESYREDYENAQKMKTEEERNTFYTNMKSAAESGWDFSTRWYITNGTNQGKLGNIATMNIIPVDLNAILQKCFRLLGQWNHRFGRSSRAEYFMKLSNNLLHAIDSVFWNENDGIWYDYDTLNDKPRQYFYLSNFAPLWTGSFKMNRQVLSDKVMTYVKKNNLSKYIGGTPTSLEYSLEQWDYPNAWPPLQAFLIQGLDRLGSFESRMTSFNLAEKWLSTNYQGYKSSGKMFEKYNSLKKGGEGGGGEYIGQDGFGWTNGVAFEFLDRWGKMLLNPDSISMRNMIPLMNKK